MRRAAVVVIFFLVFVQAFCQTHQNDSDKSEKMLQKAANEGVQLQTKTVHQSVRVEAVLLPYPVANRIFGKEIASTYAVIELTISNKSPDAAFIMHGAFIDYSRWGLSGLVGRGGNLAGKADDATEQTQTNTEPAQVASTEYRVARGQLLDAQQWSFRNWTIRLLTLGGSLASGYSFAFKETGIAKGIAAFNGNFVPGMAVAWPDGAVAQLNRISDFGYQTNKLIPKQAADIVVCFFPIDRFLTPGFKKLFQKSPALFFAPLQMVQDGKLEGDLLANLPSLDSETFHKAQILLPCYMRLRHKAISMKAPSSAAPGDVRGSNEGTDMERRVDEMLDKDCMEQFEADNARYAIRFLDLLETTSLNNIRIVVDGIMSVDTNLVPAKIDLITFDQDDKNPAFWAVTGDKAGMIKGDYLGGGEVSVTDGDKLGITEIKTVSTGSDDHNLKFTFKLTKPIETGTKLTFKITKKADEKTGSGKTAESMGFDYVVGYTVTAPQITGVSTKDKTVTVSGAGFYDTTTNPLTVSLRPPGQGSDTKDIKVKLTSQTDKELKFDVPDSVAAGCYSVIVKINTVQAPPSTQTVPVPSTQSCK